MMHISIKVVQILFRDGRMPAKLDTITSSVSEVVEQMQKSEEFKTFVSNVATDR